MLGGASWKKGSGWKLIVAYRGEAAEGTDEGTKVGAVVVVVTAPNCKVPKLGGSKGTN